MEAVKNTLKIFIDEIPTEDFMHLKHTMSDHEISDFLDSWVKKYCPKHQGRSVEKYIQKKNNYLLKVTVEDERVQFEEVS